MRKIMMFLVFFSFIGMQVFAQNNVSGKVTDMNGDPVPGASVRVKGYADIGTITDLNGAYSVNAPTEATTLIFSFVGMKTTEVEIEGQTTINTSLENEDVGIDEVIVVAYGTAKKSTFTGSATQVNGEDLAELPVTTITDALQGKSSGLQINSSSGDPGSGSVVRIRGVGSLKASSAPLYVLDGVVINSGNVSQLYDKDYPDDLAATDVLSTLNPNDIESMTVLKDASATAIYGARAANGVILITTKKGKKGKKGVVTFGAKYGMMKLPPKRGYKFLNSTEYYKLYYDAYRAEGESSADANASVIASLSNNNPYNVAAPLDENGNLVSGAQIITDTYWKDEVLRTGTTQEYDLSMTGGSAKTSYFMSFGYASTDGIIKGTDFDRYSARVNIDSEVLDWLNIGTNTNLSYTDQNRTAGSGAGSSPIRNANLYPNAVSVYAKDTDGNIMYDVKGKPIYNFNNPVSMDFNPLFTADNDKYNTKNFRLISSVYAEIDFGKIVKGLKFRTDNSLDFYTIKDFQFYNPFHGNAGGSIKGRGYSYGTWNSLWSTSNKLFYTKKLDVHTFDAMIAMEASENTENVNHAHVTGYAVYGDVVLPALANAAVYEDAYTKDNKWSMVSYIGRLNYDYKDKYYLSMTYRMDGSSRFGENNKYAGFYSAGASWRISEESFMSTINWIDNLKLRLSYGSSGNDQVGLYDYITNFSSWNYDGVAGNALFKPGNANLKWESNVSTTVGLDFLMFSNRLEGSVEWYKRVTDGLLYEVPISLVSGFEDVISNAAEITNSGFEFNLGYGIIRNNNFSWDVNVNYTINKNEITSLPVEEQIDGSKLWKEGGSMFDFYLREYAGVDSQTGEALFYADVLDVDGEPTGERTISNYTNATRYVQGSSQPDGYGSFTNIFRYKGWSLSGTLFFSNGGQILDYIESELVNDGSNIGKQAIDKQLNAWKQPGDITDVPIFVVNNTTSSNGRQSTRFLYDATFMKLKTVTLSYQLPESLLSRVGLSKATVYISGNNLLVWTKDKDYQGYDPEIGLNGLTNNVTPNPMTLIGGLRISF